MAGEHVPAGGVDLNRRDHAIADGTYLGASIAVHLFEELPPTTVTLFRVLFGALPILVLSSRSRRPWTRTELRAAAVFGLATAAMNLNMLLQYEAARQYSGRELADMLGDAGFVDISVTPTFGYYSIVAGRKPR